MTYKLVYRAKNFDREFYSDKSFWNGSSCEKKIIKENI